MYGERGSGIGGWDCVFSIRCIWRIGDALWEVWSLGVLFCLNTYIPIPIPPYLHTYIRSFMTRGRVGKLSVIILYLLCEFTGNY